MIKIGNVVEDLNFPFLLRCDEYIPVWFETFEEVLLGRHIMIRKSNSSNTSLMEFTFSEDSLILRGITLVLFDETHSPSRLPEAKTILGLPVIELPQGITFREELPSNLDFFEPFTVGLGDDFLEIKFADTSKIDLIVQFEKLTFLTQKNTLCGIRLNNLNAEEMSVLAPFFTRLEQ